MTIPAYALYRRSRSHQDLSVEEQRQAVRGWAGEQGYTIVREFADDASGLDTERRREFLALLELCARPELRQASTVLCYDVSRFSRLDPEEAGFHEYSLRRAGVRVIYTHEAGANESGVTGHLVKALKRVLAHDYSQKLSQVVSPWSAGTRRARALDRGIAPYGYRRVIRGPDGVAHPAAPGRWKAKGETAFLEPEPLAADVIREIYAWYVTEELGLAAIAARLNAQAIPAPASLRRTGVAAWTKGTIWAILRNPLYRGVLVYGKARYSEIGKKRGRYAGPPRSGSRCRAPSRRSSRNRSGRRLRPNTGPALRSRAPLAPPVSPGGPDSLRAVREALWANKQGRGWEIAYYVCGGYVASGTAVCDGFRIPLSLPGDRRARRNPETAPAGARSRAAPPPTPRAPAPAPAAAPPSRASSASSRPPRGSSPDSSRPWRPDRRTYRPSGGPWSLWSASEPD